MQATMDDDDLRALEKVLEIARPSQALRYSRKHSIKDSERIWSRANNAVTVFRMMLGQTPDKTGSLLEVRQVRRLDLDLPAGG